MRAPLDQFADRLVRNEDVTEFITGLVMEKGVDPRLIVNASKRLDDPTRKCTADLDLEDELPRRLIDREPASIGRPSALKGAGWGGLAQ